METSKNRKNNPLIAVALQALCIASAAHAQVLCRWTAESSLPVQAVFECYRGETLQFSPAFTAYRQSITNFTSYTLLWQTNGMGSVWWSTNILAFVPAMDCGADSYTVFIRAAGADGVSYRANCRVDMRFAPGAEPNALPLPAPSIDFAAVAVTNAPWVSGEDWRAGSNALAGAMQPLGPRLDLLESGTSRWDLAHSWGDHAAAGYLASSLWLSWLDTNTYVQTESDPIALAALAAYRPDRLFDAADPYLFSRIEGGTNVVVYSLAVTGTNYIISGTFIVDDGPTLTLTNAPLPFASAPWSADVEGGWAVVFYGGISAWTADTSGGFPVTLVAGYDPPGYSGGGMVGIESYDYTTNEVARYPLIADPLPRADFAAGTNHLVQTYILTTNSWMTVSNGTLSVAILTNGYTDTIWSSAESAGGLDPSFSNAVWGALSDLSAALGGKADLAWGTHTPYGEANPDPEYMTWLNSPATVFASGAQWSTDGTFAVLTTAGTVAFAAGESGQFRVGPNSTNWFGYVSGGSVTIGAVAESLAVTEGGTSNGIATIVYPYSGGDWPALWFTPALSVDFTEMEGVAWVDNTNGTATVTAPATAPGGFYSATTTAVFDNYFRSTMPARLDGGVFGATNAPPVIFDSVIQIESGGKTYRIPAQEVQ